MPIYGLLYLASLVTYTLGAVAFSVLTFTYWRERGGGRRGARGGRVFLLFTVVCAAAFLVNLAMQAAGAAGAAGQWSNALEIALGLVTAFTGPLIAHLVLVEEEPAAKWWAGGLAALYASGFAVATLNAANEAGWMVTTWAESAGLGPAVLLAVSAVFGVARVATAPTAATRAARRHRLRTASVLGLLAAATMASITASNPFFAVVPDYLVLAFFCVTLYHRERLVFFDVLIKRGLFLACGLVSLTVAALALIRGWPSAAAGGDEWMRPWMWGLALAPFWLAAPWIYLRLSCLVDRVGLRRAYSAAVAEREFSAAVQAASTEEELEREAAAVLSRVFRAPATVRLSDSPGRAGEDAEGGMIAPLPPAGLVSIAPRADLIPFLSGDITLLESLGRTLAVVAENVRFRRQQEQLRLLASRAELRALRAQINPHFLFNALNTIAGLIQEQPELADETILHLAEVFRYALRAPDSEWVRLSEEMEFVRAYLQVEKARFGDRLEVEIEVEAEAGGCLVPAMSVQPLVENAVKHGISPVDGPGRVEVRAVVEAGLLSIGVVNTGPGFPEGVTLEGAAPGNGHGHGLRNVSDRLKGYYGPSRAGLEWECGGGLTRVWLRMPAGE
jgi:hypothetical protein